LNSFASTALSCGQKALLMVKVLVVEDEAMVLVLAESVIQSAGYETISAASLSEAEALISSPDSHLDLVFTDISLGDDTEGGVQIGRLVRKQRPAMPVLYTSGRNLTDGLKEMLVERSVFLPKPYTDTQLVEALAALLRS
jgi:two-component system cell cycle sensor histidine kinase/response regulator CckA